MTTKEDILKGISSIQDNREKDKTNSNCNNIYCSNTYCDYCLNCVGCIRCSYLVDCKNCTDCKDCFCCSDIKSKQYMVENVQLTKEEYSEFFNTLEDNNKYKKQFRSLLKFHSPNKSRCFDITMYHSIFEPRYYTEEHINEFKRYDRIFLGFKIATVLLGIYCIYMILC
jgi:hypothetical protein